MGAEDYVCTLDCSVTVDVVTSDRRYLGLASAGIGSGSDMVGPTDLVHGIVRIHCRPHRHGLVSVVALANGAAWFPQKP